MPSLPRSQLVREQVPCDDLTEISVVRYGRSETLTTFTSAAATGEAFVTLIVQVILWPRRAVVGCAVFSIARSTCSPRWRRQWRRCGWQWWRIGRSRRPRRLGRVRREGRRRRRDAAVGERADDEVAVRDRAVDLRPRDRHVRDAVSGAGDGRFVVGQVRARACSLTDRPLPDADRVGTGSGPVAAARQHLSVQEQVEDAGVAGRGGDLPQLEDRRTARRRTRRGHGLARERPGQRPGVAERGLEGACPASRLEQLRLAAVGGRGRELVRRADRDLNREVVVVAVAPDRLLGSRRLGRRRIRAPAPAASDSDLRVFVIVHRTCLVTLHRHAKPWRSPLRRRRCRRSGRRSARRSRRGSCLAAADSPTVCAPGLTAIVPVVPPSPTAGASPAVTPSISRWKRPGSLLGWRTLTIVIEPRHDGFESPEAVTWLPVSFHVNADPVEAAWKASFTRPG